LLGGHSLLVADVHKPIIFAVLLCAAIAVPLGIAGARGAAVDNSAPTEAEQRALLDKVFVNQHADDAAIDLFERIEKRTNRTNDGSKNNESVKTVRVVPTGAGAATITLEDAGRPADAGAIRAQMDQLAKSLAASLDTSNAETRRAREKQERRAHDRSDLVNAIREAFLFTWMGREVRDGRTLAKFHLDPNPNYKATSRTTDALRHAVATLWVDEATAQMAKLDAEISSDISFLAGIAGKLYHGGHILMAQAEVEPGVWEPIFTQTDLTARKLFTTSEYHLVTEASRYKRIGPPAQALAEIRKEIALGPAKSSRQ
jgi:hypothetical protein